MTRLSEFLRPLELLDLPRVYQQHAVVVDFLLYLVLFNGVAQAVFHRRFEGRSGRLLAGAVGTALAVAMMGFGAATGFTLASLGPIAAAVILLLAGVTVFHSLRRVGSHLVTAGALTVLVLGLGIEAAAPTLGHQLAAVVPVVDLAVLAAFLILFWRGMMHLMPHGAAGRLAAGATALEATPPAPRMRPRPVRGDAVGQVRQDLRRQKPVIGRRLKTLTREELKPCRQIQKELAHIREILERKGTGARAREEIAAAVRRIPPQRRELALAIERVKDLDRRLAAFDTAVLRELRVAWERIPESQRPKLRKLVREEQRKLQFERRIAELERVVADTDGRSAAMLDRTVQAILAGDTPGALTAVREAERIAAQAAEAIHEVMGIERELRRLTRLELRQVRRLARS